MAQVLVRLVGADDHVYPNFIDVMQWLAESNLLEMIVDKLSPSVSERLTVDYWCACSNHSHIYGLQNLFLFIFWSLSS